MPTAHSRRPPRPASAPHARIVLAACMLNFRGRVFVGRREVERLTVEREQNGLRYPVSAALQLRATMRPPATTCVTPRPDWRI